MAAEITTSADSGGVHEVTAAEARQHLSQLLDLVRDGEFVYLTRRGTRIAALMPADIAENYERIEDEYWARRVAETNGSDTIPWQQAVTELESGCP